MARAALTEADTVLFPGDNAGGTVFDRVLIEIMDRPVTHAVKAGPIVNNATRDSALTAGRAPLAEIIDNGSDSPGILLPECSANFR